MNDDPEFVTAVPSGMRRVGRVNHTPLNLDEFQRVRDRGAAEARTAHTYHRSVLGEVRSDG